VVGRVSIRGWSSNTVRAQPALPRVAAGARTAECGLVCQRPIEYSRKRPARSCERVPVRARTHAVLLCARACVGGRSWTQYVHVSVKKVQGAEGMGTLL
jgi:hypothetical protein